MSGKKEKPEGSKNSAH